MVGQVLRHSMVAGGGWRDRGRGIVVRHWQVLRHSMIARCRGMPSARNAPADRRPALATSARTAAAAAAGPAALRVLMPAQKCGVSFLKGNGPSDSGQPRNCWAQHWSA